MNRKESLATAVDARERLVTDLRRLDPAQWETPSLCAGWAVRDVVGHLIGLDNYYRRGDRLVRGAIAARGLNRFLLEDARRIAAAQSPDELITAFEATRYETRIGARFHLWTIVPLVETFVHGQDIRRPLGMPHTTPAGHVLALADHLRTLRKRPWGSRTNTRGVRFESADADRVYGSGPVARGPLEAIVMVFAGRRSALDELSGDGAAELRRRWSPR